MDWTSILSAVLAGGLAGQLTTLLLGDRFASRRYFRSWLRAERFKVYSELLVLSASHRPECGYERWPGAIRALCQKVFLLYPGGRPPKSAIDAMEAMFQRAYSLRSKHEIVDDEWIEGFRRDGDTLRHELSVLLQAD